MSIFCNYFSNAAVSGIPDYEEPLKNKHTPGFSELS